MRCLNDFVVHQNEYYNQCYRYTMDLQRELALPLMNGNANIGQPQSNDSAVSDTNNRNQPMKMQSTELHAAATAANYDNDTSNNKTELNNHTNNNKRQAKCLNDYQAQTDSELSLFANEIINVSIDNTNMDTDWMIGQRSNGQMGKVPVAYLEILN